jgi:predicted lipoprotein with Yx(FWY)xxD motif
VRTRLIATVLLLGLLTACADEPLTPTTGDSASSSSPPTTETDPPTEASPQPSVRPTGTGRRVLAAASDFGTILFDGTGQAIYLFDVETTPRPRCYGACADAWPPVLTDGPPRAGDRVDESLLGTTQRTDGTTQVTYDGHPLYFYAHEGKHEVKCHDVFLNGGNWYAIQPDGQRAP